jgi:predicted ArsR family transcriptional regulator
MAGVHISNGRRQPETRLQRQARALGDPTRFAIFTYLAEADAPVRVAVLTGHFRLNHNAIRQHLAKLCDAGLVVEELGTRSGPGRPALLYRLAPGVAGSWGTSGPYEQLAALLVDLVTTGRTAREVGAEAGRAAAGGAASAAEATERLQAEMARRGFEPRRVERPGGVELVLGHCPFRTAAVANPELVCDLHLGLAEGIAEGLGTEVEVEGLIARNPLRAGCRLLLRHRGAGHDERVGTP